MPSPNNDNPSHRRFLGKSLVLAAGLLAANPALGAFREAMGTRSVVWELVILAIVAVVTLASAALPLAAIKQWQGPWRIAALTPLGVLAVWIAIIVMARLLDPDSHALWALEIFGWAMLNMIYMVLLFTIKRILAKADGEQA